MPAITRWSRSTACSGRAPLRGEQLAQRRRVGPRLGAERRDRVVLLDLVGAQDLHPRRLLRPELAQAQLAARRRSGRAGARCGRAATRACRRAAAAPRDIRCTSSGEVAGDVDDDVLAAAPDALDRRAVDRVQRRVERLQRVDARRERGLDRRAAQRRVEAARSDLDLGQLGHMVSLRAPAAARSRRPATGRRRRRGSNCSPAPGAVAGTPRGAAGPCGRRGRSSSRRTSPRPRRCGP